MRLLLQLLLVYAISSAAAFACTAKVRSSSVDIADKQFMIVSVDVFASVVKRNRSVFFTIFGTYRAPPVVGNKSIQSSFSHVASVTVPQGEESVSEEIEFFVGALGGIPGTPRVSRIIVTGCYAD